jgi:flagellar motor switch protein FliG
MYASRTTLVGKILYCFIILGIFSTNIIAETDTSIEKKLSIEASLEERLRKVLVEITGTDKLIVIVNAQLYSEKEKKELIPQEAKKPKTVLPGVPVKESIAERKIEELLAPLDLGETRTMIKKLSATVILDKKIPKAVVDIAKKVTIGLLGIDFSRGDELVFEQMEFYKSTFTYKELLHPPHIYYVAAIFLLLLFVISSMVYFFNPFKILPPSVVNNIINILRAGQEKASTVGVGINEFYAAAAAPQLLPLAPTASVNFTPLQRASSSENNKPFSFINSSNRDALLKILQSEPVEVIAVVINYISPEIASFIFNSLDVKRKNELSLYLSRMEKENISPESLRSVEKHIKERLEFFYDSKDTLVNLLNSTDKALQNSILNTLRQHAPEVFNKIRAEIVSFEDILSLPPQAIMAILQQVGYGAFSQLLKSSSAEVKDKVLNSLPEGIRQRLQQEIELGRPLTEEQINSIKRQVNLLIKTYKSTPAK